MPRYNFVGKLPNGKTVRGIISGGSLEQATHRLKQQGVAVVDLSLREQDSKQGFGGGGRISFKDVVIFTRQFSVMQEAGMGLIDTFEILSRQARNASIRNMTLKLKDSIKSGSNLGDALAKFPKQFNELYISMVKAGEMSGQLPAVLDRLARYLEKSSKLIGQIKTAMVYPTIVLTVALGIIWGLLVFVVPIFQKIFEGSKGGLPVPTQILVNASKFIRENIGITIFGIIIAVIAFRVVLKTPTGRYKFHYLLLKVPIIGNIIHKISVSRFTTTLGSLIKSGVPIIDGLALAGRASGNLVVSEAVTKAAQEVVEGKPLAYSLERTGLFPVMVVNMVRVGEETGSLDSMLERVNVFYEDEVDEAIKGMTSAIEPLMIVGLGSIIAGFVIAMYLPVFQMATAMD